MVVPPGAPVTNLTSPSSNTMVGLMEESIRLKGWISLATPPTAPKKLGTPAFTLKSSISLFSKKPAPSTTTPEPKLKLIVVVLDTALPYWSKIEKWVVCSLSVKPGRIFSVVEILLRFTPLARFAIYSGLVSAATGTS